MLKLYPSRASLIAEKRLLRFGMETPADETPPTEEEAGNKALTQINNLLAKLPKEQADRVRKELLGEKSETGGSEDKGLNRAERKEGATKARKAPKRPLQEGGSTGGNDDAELRKATNNLERFFQEENGNPTNSLPPANAINELPKEAKAIDELKPVMDDQLLAAIKQMNAPQMNAAVGVDVGEIRAPETVEKGSILEGLQALKGQSIFEKRLPLTIKGVRYEATFHPDGFVLWNKDEGTGKIGTLRLNSKIAENIPLNFSDITWTGSEMLMKLPVGDKEFSFAVPDSFMDVMITAAAENKDFAWTSPAIGKTAATPMMMLSRKPE